jgi:cytochrome c peroxidase
VLGKALFWDKEAGSDGVACAGCHFSAGADSRIVNQLNPGFNSQPAGDRSFGSIPEFEGEIVPAVPGLTKSGSTVDSTYVLKPEDFPFHNTVDKTDRESPLVITTNDVASSAGAFDRRFIGALPFGIELCGPASGAVFHAGRRPARQVEPRNTPTTINAVFNHRNFWDGRATNMFNGVGVFGMRDIAGDPNRRLVVLDGGVPRLTHLDIRNASLASQAVGPPLSALEMSCAGRTFPDVGRLLLANRPLRTQIVHPDDSVLGGFADPSGMGLSSEYRYSELIKKAFDPKFWSAAGMFRIVDGQLVRVSNAVNPVGMLRGGYTQMELNFSMFWGISIMLYESTLVSDQSKFDEWFQSCRPSVRNPDGNGSVKVPIDNPTVTCADGQSPLRNGFTAQEVVGFGLFNNGGVGIRQPGSPSCAGCHTVGNPSAPPLFSEAQFRAGQTFVPVERSRIDNPVSPPSQLAGGVHDRGFFNIGTRPASFDLGNGGTDPYGNPLSIARLFLAEQAGETVVEPTGILNRCSTPGLLEGGGTPPFLGCPSATPPPLDKAQERELVDGSFKTPGLRNVALTPPYFHYGGYSDLRSVVEFYARGGNHRLKSHVDAAFAGDTSGSGPLGKGPVPVSGGNDFGTNVDFFIRDIKSTGEQIDAMVAFMLTLTDPRVQCDAAPFDHPELRVAAGVNARHASRNRTADDVMATIPAVGAAGYQADGRGDLCLPNTGTLFDPALRNRLQ